MSLVLYVTYSFLLSLPLLRRRLRLSVYAVVCLAVSLPIYLTRLSILLLVSTYHPVRSQHCPSLYPIVIPVIHAVSCRAAYSTLLPLVRRATDDAWIDRL